MAEGDVYRPVDRLSVWYLREPQVPRLVGVLSLVHANRGVALQYASAWSESGFALSEDLPLTSELWVPRDKDTVVGSIDDARPDRWGERLIRLFERSSRLSLLEFLLFAGNDRYGALGVSQRLDAYEPWPATPLPELQNLNEMAEVVRKVLANEAVSERQRRLVQPGMSLGGARPKSVVVIDGEPWLVKFSEGEDTDTELIEHALWPLRMAGTPWLHGASIGWRAAGSMPCLPTLP